MKLYTSKTTPNRGTLPYFFSVGMKQNRRVKKNIFKSSHHGLEVTNSTNIHEDEGLIPGLTQWVTDLALSRAVVTDTARIWRGCSIGQ